jgi:hypothetical protein
MTGALIQVVAQGAQDPSLIGNPQITFYKGVYRRHTNFAMEEILQDFNGSANFGGRATATISRNGDLIAECILEVQLPVLGKYEVPASGSVAGGNFSAAYQKQQRYVPDVGHHLLEEVDLEIGGQRIDKHYSHWLNIWSELTQPAEKAVGFKVMTGGAESFATSSFYGQHKLHIPLQFFFNRNPGLALPLIALQYHECKLTFKFAPLASLIHTKDMKGVPLDQCALDAKLYVNYIYLDSDERRRFAQTSHEMLVDQLQFTGAESVHSGNNKIRLNFNHPVKELVWVIIDKEKTNEDAKYMKMDMGKLTLNGHDRFSERDGSYFNLVQPYLRHTRVPTHNVYSYSFALNPEEFQPSGHCNMSRIDNATLNITMPAETHDGCGNCDYADVHVYARSLNQLRIQGGMAGLAFAN